MEDRHGSPSVPRVQRRRRCSRPLPCCATPRPPRTNGFRVKYFPVPEARGSRDVTACSDGVTMWFNCQGNGKLGRLDPRDGSYRLIDLGPGSAPHGVIVGPDRAAWVTDGGQNAIVRVDNDHKVTVFKLPIKDYTNLNTAAFDKSGIYWFTGQSGYHGRLDPKSGDMQVFKSPGGHGSYGMTVTPKGDIWYASLAGNHIAKIDLKTGNASDGRAGHAEPGRAPGVVGFEGPHLGQRVEQRQRLGAQSGRRLVAHLAAAGPAPAHLFGLCGRQGQGLAHRLRRQRDRALRPGDREVQRVPERQAERQCAPDGRQARPGLGRRVRHQPAGDDRDARSRRHDPRIACRRCCSLRCCCSADAAPPRTTAARCSSRAAPAIRSIRPRKAMAGPNLAGLIGRKVAGDPNSSTTRRCCGRRASEGRVWTAGGA